MGLFEFHQVISIFYFVKMQSAYPISCNQKPFVVMLGGLLVPVPVSVTVAVSVSVFAGAKGTLVPMERNQKRQSAPALVPTARAFVPRALKTAPVDERKDIHGQMTIETLKRGAAWDLRILAGLTTELPGLKGEICISSEIDQGLSEKEKERRAAIRQRMFAPDPRFTASKATVAQVLGLVRRIYLVEREEDVLAISDEFISLCKNQLHISETEIERFVMNLANLRDEVASTEVSGSVIGSLGI